MSTPLEHDYIGLSEIEKNTSTVSTEENEKKNNVLNHKETELRLGLPGSESPERITGGTGVSFLGKVSEDKNEAYPLGLLKNFVPSGKRGFSDAIDVSGKWVFSSNGGSDVDLGKGSVLFSPRGGNGGKPLGGAENSIQQSCSAATLMNDVVPQNPNPSQEKKPQISATNDQAPPAKAQVVGWPPIRSFRKNTLATNPAKKKDDTEVKSECLYVKVSMDGAPYLRKVDLKTYTNYVELSSALGKMFSCFMIDLQQNSGQCNYNGIPGRDGLSESRLRDLLHGSDCVLTYEDKDGDWMLVGDVPWDMFTDSCKRLRIMKGSEAIGLAPRTMEKSKNKN